MLSQPLALVIEHRRRGSLEESRTDANKELKEYGRKQILVRTLRHGRRKSIVICGALDKPRNYPVSRLNRYDKKMKKHRGPISMMSELESIDESGELDDQFD